MSAEASVPYALLRTLRACLDGTADQPAWDRAKDELDDLLLTEPDESPVTSVASIIAEREGEGNAVAVRSGPMTAWNPRDGLTVDGEPIAPTYPHTEFNEDAGVWVRWEDPWIGKVVGPPEGEYEGGRWEGTD